MNDTIPLSEQVDLLLKTNDYLSRALLTGAPNGMPHVHYLFGRPLSEIAAMLDASASADAEQPAIGSREWAEQQARAGKKVRHKSWATDDWTDFPNLYPMPSFETGWSLYEPEQPDDDFHPATEKDAVVWCGAGNNPYISLKAIQALVPKLTAIEEPEPEFKTSRATEPASPAPMTDEEIVNAAFSAYWMDGFRSFHAGAREVIRLTREQVAREMAERRERAEALAEALALILPLAKGYVARNNVGNNRAFISQAEAALDVMQGLK